MPPDGTELNLCNNKLKIQYHPWCTTPQRKQAQKVKRIGTSSILWTWHRESKQHSRIEVSIVAKCKNQDGEKKKIK